MKCIHCGTPLKIAVKMNKENEYELVDFILGNIKFEKYDDLNKQIRYDEQETKLFCPHCQHLFSYKLMLDDEQYEEISYTIKNGSNIATWGGVKRWMVTSCYQWDTKIS